MRLQGFLYLFAVLSLAVAAPPVISHYAGTGYNLLKGNPLTDSVDPGFTTQIFNFTYHNQNTTHDGKYTIPDNVSYVDVTSCVFTSSAQTYRGTQSYQSELSAKAQVSAGYDGVMLQASFSASVDYKNMENQTS